MKNPHLNDGDRPITRKPLFNEDGETALEKRRMVGGDTTNLNDFNNVKFPWTNEWYRQSMNNFWIPEEISLTTDVQDYRKLSPAEKNAYDKMLSFLTFLDSIQTNMLLNLAQYVTANEVNLCLAIQTYQEEIHSQSYSYMLDTICYPDERDSILYSWRDDGHLLLRDRFIGNLYDEFFTAPTLFTFVKTIMASYILEGIYFYSGFMFFYNLGRNQKMPGSVQEIRFINRDEKNHLWLFRQIIKELQAEHPAMFTPEKVEVYRDMIKQGTDQEIAWGKYVIGDAIPGLNTQMIVDYISYLGNLRCSEIGFGVIYPGHEKEPETMFWVEQYSNANMIKTDFFEARNTAYAKSTAMKDDL